MEWHFLEGFNFYSEKKKHIKMSNDPTRKIWNVQNMFWNKNFNLYLIALIFILIL